MSDSSAAPDPDRVHLLHVDMDAFYASVMTRGRPDLAGRPVIVGGGHRGVVLSANYPARDFGIRSGMSGVEARRLCPTVVAVPPDFGLLVPLSREIMQTFRTFTPTVEVMSLDEAFLDVRGAARLFGRPEEIAEQVRRRIRADHGIDCSVGIAASVPVAKLASRRAKPNGVCVITPRRFAQIVHPLDVGDLYGVGPATRERLHRLGLITVGDVAALRPEDLRAMLGQHLGAMLGDLAHGLGRSELRPGGAGVFGFGEGAPEGSMGSQRTLAVDVTDRDRLARELLRLSLGVAARVRAGDRLGRTVAITVRFGDFETVSRSRTLGEPTDVSQEIHRVALGLLDDVLGEHPGRQVRLLGVRVERLRRRRAGDGHQMMLGERAPGWPDADRAADRVAGRFGRGILGRASTLDRPVGPSGHRRPHIL